VENQLIIIYFGLGILDQHHVIPLDVFTYTCIKAYNYELDTAIVVQCSSDYDASM
jgi:hypothetical protein